jgi:hypothetical protein
MEGSNRRFTLSAVALPFLFLAMSGLALANVITVNTLDGGSESAPLCTLEDAVTAANTSTAINGCGAGSGNDEIVFSVTGTIFTDNPLVITDPELTIVGPNTGSVAGPNPPAGIVIDGGTTHEIMETTNTRTEVENLTFAHGNITTINYLGVDHAGGAINAEGTDLYVFNCSFNDNAAADPGLGGAILGDNGGFVEIENSTFVGNSSHFGGAIWNGNSEMYLNNLTLSANVAGTGEGGAIGYSSGLATHTFMRGSILAGNTGGNCETSPPTPLEDEGYNLSDDASCSFSGTSEDSVTTLDLDPTGLHNNGGPTETIALESGSKAIGFDKNCVDLNDDVVSNDQRLYKRANSPTSCSSGAYEYGARPPLAISTTGEKLQIARSTSPDSDSVNMMFSYIDYGPGASGPACDSGNNGLNGVSVSLFQGTCAALPGLGLSLDLDPFSVHTVGSESYGTFYGTSPGEVSARIVQLPTPANTCGEWTLTIEDSGIATATYGLTGGSGPGTTYALVVKDEDGNAGCLDITNAIAGTQVAQPSPSRDVRR